MSRYDTTLDAFALTPFRALATLPAGRFPESVVAVGPVRRRPSPHPTRAASPLHIQSILLFVPVLLFSVVAHEYAHGYAALRQGDDTALMLGRLTWNPVKHIDPFMTILLPVMLLVLSHGRFVLGGAKPVPVNPRKYRNFKRGDIIVSLAGVATNIAIAIGCVLLIPVFAFGARIAPGIGTSFAILQAMMILGLQLNLVLALFNLIPIPPLDGSHVIKYLMPVSWAVRYAQVGRVGLILLIVLLYTGAFNVLLRPVDLAYGGMIGTVQSFVLPSTIQWLPQ
jgi:Zn-dependent protease